MLKAYDCSEGYLHLLRELFTHKTRPAAKQLEPHLQFIVKSVLCHYSQRSYSDVRQMVGTSLVAVLASNHADAVLI